MGDIKLTINGEEILWSTRPDLDKKIFQIILSISFLIILITLLFWYGLYGAALICSIYNDLFYCIGIPLFIIMFFIGVFTGYSIKWIFDYTSLIRREYFITSQGEYEKVTVKMKKHDGKASKDIYFMLSFNEIEKIVIKPIKIWNKGKVHVDFYSKILLDDFNKFILNVKDKNEIDIEDNILLSKEGRFHRFYYVKDYKQLMKALNEFVPGKLVIK